MPGPMITRTSSVLLGGSSFEGLRKQRRQWTKCELREMAIPVVLFLCTHSSALPQISESQLRRFAGDQLEVTIEVTNLGSRRLSLIRWRHGRLPSSDRHLRTRIGDLYRYLNKPRLLHRTGYDTAMRFGPSSRSKTVSTQWSFEASSQATGSDEERPKVIRP